MAAGHTGAAPAWHGHGRILLGRDPDDFEAPAVAFDADGRLICKEIELVKAGVYDSVEGAREAARNRKAARVAAARAAEANGYLDDADFAAAWRHWARPTILAPAPGEVVGARFGAPLQPERKATPTSVFTEEMMEEIDRANGIDLSRHGR